MRRYASNRAEWFVIRCAMSLFLILLGVVLSPLRAMAATIPVLIAYDADGGPDASTQLGGPNAVRPEAERSRINVYDSVESGYDPSTRLRGGAGMGAVNDYDDDFEHDNRHELRGDWEMHGAVGAVPAAEEGAAAVRPLVYGPSAGGRLAELAEQLGGDTLTSLPKPPELGWEAFSKQTLDAAAASGRPVIFDLTHVQDLPGVLSGTGQYANTVTGAELRYIQANWAQFQGNVTFIGGGVPW